MKTIILQLLVFIVGHSVLSAFSMPQTSTGDEDDVQGNDDQLPYLLVATYSTIYKLYPWPYSSELNKEILLMEEFGGIESLGYHYRMKRVFWTNIDTLSIRTAWLNGTGLTDLVSRDIGYPVDLSVDWINDKLYWTDRSKRRIEEYNLVTGYRRIVVNTGASTVPTGIVVYPYPGLGWVYWTDILNERIDRVSVTGDDKQTIVGALGTRCIRLLALDYYAQAVYWMDNCDFSLRSVTITGNQLNNNVRIDRGGNRATSLGLALYEDIIYWAARDKVYAVNRTTGTPVEEIHTSTSSFNEFKSVVVVHPNSQPSATIFVEKIIDSIDVEDYNSSCSPLCANGQCIPPGLCGCNKGWSGVNCDVDVNECSLLNGGCQHNCTNLDGSYYCSCFSGYTLDSDGLLCEYINMTSMSTTASSLLPSTTEQAPSTTTLLQSMYSSHTHFSSMPPLFKSSEYNNMMMISPTSTVGLQPSTTLSLYTTSLTGNAVHVFSTIDPRLVTAVLTTSLTGSVQTLSQLEQLLTTTVHTTTVKHMTSLTNSLLTDTYTMLPTTDSILYTMSMPTTTTAHTKDTSVPMQSEDSDLYTYTPLLITETVYTTQLSTTVLHATPTLLPMPAVSSLRLLTTDMYYSTPLAVPDTHTSTIIKLIAHTPGIHETSSTPFVSESTRTSIIVPTPSTSNQVLTTTLYTEQSSSLIQSSLSTYVPLSSSLSTKTSITLTESPTESQPPTDKDPIGGVQLVTVVTAAVAGGILFFIVVVLSIVIVLGCYMRYSRRGSYTLKHRVERSDSKSPNSYNSRTSFGVNSTHSNSPSSDANT